MLVCRLDVTTKQRWFKINKKIWLNQIHFTGGIVVGILGWIVFGLITGWLAGKFTKTRLSLLNNIVLGVVGAAVGGFIGEALGFNGVTNFNIASFAWAVIGSILVLWVMDTICKK